MNQSFAGLQPVRRCDDCGDQGQFGTAKHPVPSSGCPGGTPVMAADHFVTGYQMNWIHPPGPTPASGYPPITNAAVYEFATTQDAAHYKSLCENADGLASADGIPGIPNSRVVARPSGSAAEAFALFTKDVYVVALTSADYTVPTTTATASALGLALYQAL